MQSNEKKIGRPIEWTPEKIEQTCDEILQFIVEHPNCMSISKALATKKLYSNILDHWEKTHGKGSPFLESLYVAREIVKSRTIDHGFFSKTGSRFAEFILQANYGMATKKKLDVEGPSSPPTINLNLTKE